MKRIPGNEMLVSPYLDLLLEADPDPAAVRNYLQFCQGLCDLRDDCVAGICVFGPGSDYSGIEIYNVSVASRFRRQGIAEGLIKSMLAREMGPVRVRTGSTSFAALSLYQKLDFRMIAIVSDYFTKHYQEPIFENGIQLRDQIVLERKARSSGH